MLVLLSIVDDVRSFPTLGSAADALAARWPDVVVVPSDAPRGELMALLDRRPATTRCLVVIRSEQPAELAHAAQVEADGYLMESELGPQALGSCIAEVVGGGMPIPPALGAQLLTSARAVERQARHRPPLLTPREHDVLQLLVEGCSNKQVAMELGISPHGAKRHVANVLMKLNCSNRTQAVARAITEGLCPNTTGAR